MKLDGERSRSSTMTGSSLLHSSQITGRRGKIVTVILVGVLDALLFFAQKTTGATTLVTVRSMVAARLDGNAHCYSVGVGIGSKRTMIDGSCCSC